MVSRHASTLAPVPAPRIVHSDYSAAPCHTDSSAEPRRKSQRSQTNRWWLLLAGRRHCDQLGDDRPLALRETVAPTPTPYSANASQTMTLVASGAARPSRMPSRMSSKAGSLGCSSCRPPGRRGERSCRCRRPGRLEQRASRSRRTPRRRSGRSPAVEVAVGAVVAGVRHAADAARVARRVLAHGVVLVVMSASTSLMPSPIAPASVPLMLPIIRQVRPWPYSCQTMSESRSPSRMQRRTALSLHRGGRARGAP